MGYDSILYLAYSQLSVWQLYNNSPFFRENNYKPEIFLQNNVNLTLFWGWNLQLFNLGVIHESNGRGGYLERTWDRLYVETVFSSGGWSIAIRPWFILNNSSVKKYNPDIGNLGHGRIVIAYKFDCDHVISLVSHNFESGFKRGSVQLTYSFPLFQKIKGYVQCFRGYKQTLIEYNHKVNSVGVGIALSDWL